MKKSPAREPEGVETFLAALDHPFKQEVLAIRRIMLGAVPGAAEGIRWNAPRIRTSEWFATFQLRARDCVQVILHPGAKARRDANVVIPDPAALLEWLADDRASVMFRGMDDVEARRAAFADVIRQWIRHV